MRREGPDLAAVVVVLARVIHTQAPAYGATLCAIPTTPRPTLGPRRPGNGTGLPVVARSHPSQGPPAERRQGRGSGGRSA
jgi:hypothetical protein